MAPSPPTPSRLLEINLISAQDLFSASNNMKTYAVVWVRQENKCTTKVDQSGGTDPTWNEKFVFKVDKDDAVISVEVYAAACDKDATIGYVNVPLNDIFDSPSAVTRTLALPISRPSGRSQGILNMEVSHKLTTTEDYNSGSIVNGSVVKGNSGSMVNGSSLCNSDVGPSASVVAAAIAKGLYKPQVPHQTESKEATQITEWTKKEREKEMEKKLLSVDSPAGSIVAPPYSKRITSKERKKKEGTKLFSCLGCEIAITCGGSGDDDGESRKKYRNKHEGGSNKVCNLSSVDNCSQ
ncbi:hypothetical protein ERO13_A11G299600v2 [Gossypium hirsutum]|uniref:C2 domain-containing protein n=1 Tax=Gossypium hirsutum TaxID=3635 RepID=A0ABM2Z604_GOSHI|nr:uncharacterized protein LOC121210101 [Gossypium hirsutum]KAG4177303.1 hypothetical protein ERO13_A11G299600v2 [Gossypium hirsutum]